MKIYKNNTCTSGITHYELLPHAIKIKFKHTFSPYIYSESKIAKHHIQRMKELAVKGKGLSTYINQHPEVKENFD